MKTNHQMDVLCDEIGEENLDDSKALPQKLLALLRGFGTDANAVLETQESEP